MRFIRRALFGFLLFGLCVGLIGYGINDVHEKIAERANPPAARAPSEQIYPATTAQLVTSKEPTMMEAHGQIVAWRMLEIRSPMAGRIAEINDNMRNGRVITKNATLFTLEADMQALRAQDAKKALLEIIARQEDNKQALALAKRDLTQARQHTELLRQSLTRQRNLLARGVVPEASVESQEIALTQSMQASLDREEKILELEQQAKQLELQASRADLTIRDSEYQLQQTTVRAPFTGSIGEANLALGRNVTPNDRLGLLIDLASLEVRFALNHQQLSLLLDDDNRLMQRPIRASIPIGNDTLDITGQIDRIDAQTPENQGALTLYAKLDNDRKNIIRPGDFVTIMIEGRLIEAAAWVPTTAINANGEMLLVDDNDILHPHQFPIIQKLGDRFLIQTQDLPQDLAHAHYVTKWAPHLRAGLKISTIE
ncbi:MAG: HlyD family efflux transporter periplasmic adaptor subunit [Pseudomonadota bacterium]